MGRLRHPIVLDAIEQAACAFLADAIHPCRIHMVPALWPREEPSGAMLCPEMLGAHSPHCLNRKGTFAAAH
jgi:hypothetical protein